MGPSSSCSSFEIHSQKPHETAVILSCRRQPRVSVCTSTGGNAEGAECTMNDFNVPVLVNSTGLVDKDQ